MTQIRIDWRRLLRYWGAVEVRTISDSLISARFQTVDRADKVAERLDGMAIRTFKTDDRAIVVDTSDPISVSERFRLGTLDTNRT